MPGLRSLRVRVPDEAPDDWRWQLRHSIRDVAGLAARVRLTESERLGAERAAQRGFPIGITPYYLGLLDPEDPSCPIRRQVVPSAEEDVTVPGDLRDPLGEEAHSPAPELIQRYPDRALLLVTDQCAVYCRFCTRSRMVGGGLGPRPEQRLAPALEYLRAHPEVRDVILSGGDLLTMATRRIAQVVAAVRAIPSVETIRLATRVPVVLPMRLDAELLGALRSHHPLWVMTHFNHPKELTAEARAGLNRLADAGFPVMNQSVLLRGVNDRAETLEALFRGLVRERARPYYLLQADPVRGTGHLRTPLSVGLELMEALQGRLSGIALPKLIVDTPGGMGKVPVLPSWVVARTPATADEPGRTTLRTWRGVEVDYVDPP
ncbi:MAG: KamA family radical SAM protein [Polyangiaceae bacterium]|nr:KamA family radical SAM protein [Polyangiaceae bacterium]MCW5790107.1 KamA family radical SAM protein [Polyangiaceae bacterium]